MGDITFEITKFVDLNKTVTLDITKEVTVNVVNPDQLATAEADAEAFGPFALAEVDAYTVVTAPTLDPITGNLTGGTAFAYAESTSALDLDLQPVPTRIVWGVQPETGLIIKIDPSTGNVLDSFAAPGNLDPGDVQIGLSIAQGPTGTELIYINFDDGANFNNIFRLDPNTGAVQGNELTLGFELDGLGAYNNAGQELIFHSHDLVDIHQEVVGGGETFFWEDFGPAPTGALGGDDTLLQFGFFTDGNIYGYDALVDDGIPNLGPFTAPAPDIEGLAFDGDLLYASTGSGDLYTLDPFNIDPITNTAEVLNVVAVSGGALFGLGAAIV